MSLRDTCAHNSVVAGAPCVVRRSFHTLPKVVLQPTQSLFHGYSYFVSKSRMRMGLVMIGHVFSIEASESSASTAPRIEPSPKPSVHSDDRHSGQRIIIAIRRHALLCFGSSAADSVGSGCSRDSTEASAKAMPRESHGEASLL